MICPNCGTENRPFANYCHNCRHRLAQHCPNCRALNPEHFTFCDHCGHPLKEGAAAPDPLPAGPATPTARPVDNLPQLSRLIPAEFAQKLQAAREVHAMEGERRVVTMLFCDVQGSTFAASQLDPENWAEVMNGMFEHMIAPIYLYEGTVARLMGDAILAFFGAPITHEDDPQRAVLAGLDIIERVAGYRKEIAARWGVDVDVRVGINTGLVLVGKVGSDLQMEYTALGEAINLAARMEQAAAPGTVQITEHTHKYLEHAFLFEDLGALEVKGLQQPLRAYRVLGREASAALRQRGIEGLRAPLIGREREWELLSSAADLAQGEGRAVFVVGEAGLGKSRLVQELAASHAGRLHWLETASLSFEISQPYGLFQRLLRRVLETTPQYSPEDLRERIGSTVEAFPLTEQPAIRKAFESLFGLAGQDGAPPLQGEAFRGSLFQAIESYLAEQARRRPVALICDDLHWTDPASIALLEHLLPLVTSLPVLLVCPMRPETASPGWSLKELAAVRYPDRFTEIALQPLNPDDSGRLVDHLLDVNELPGALRRRILAHAEGNPFFVEEMVRELIERGVIRRAADSTAWVATGETADLVEIPDNLQALLSARIDRLGDDARRVLQLAALIGRSFYYRVLKLIVEVGARGGEAIDLDAELARLQQAEFIQVASEHPEREYIFRHVLTQEAAYQTILLRQRRRYHALVGEAMEILFPDQIDEHAARLSHHFQEAGEDEKALSYIRMAGDAAMRLWASQEAAEHYSRGLMIAARLEAAGRGQAARQQLAHLYARRGRALELGSYFLQALENYETMEAEGKRLEDRSLRLAAIVLQGTMRSIISEQFDPPKAIRLSNRGLSLAVELGDKASEARIHWNLLQVYRFIERSTDALHHGIRSLELSKELGLEEQIAYVSNDLAYTYAFNGLVDQAIAIAHEAAERWRSLDNLPMLADAQSTAAYLYAASGQIDEGIQFADQARELSASINNTWGESHSMYQIGIAYWARGEIDRAIQAMQTAYQKGDEAGFVVPQIWSRGTLALLYSNLGDLESAARISREAQDRASAFLPSGYSAFVRSIAARVALLEGDLERAEGTAQPYDYNPDASLGKLAAPFVEYVHATILFARRDYGAVKLKTERMITFFRETGLGLYLPGAYYLRGRALLALDEPGPARESLEAGRTCARLMKARWWLWLLEKHLASIEANRQVRRELADSSQSHFAHILAHIPDESLRETFLQTTRQEELQA